MENYFEIEYNTLIHCTVNKPDVIIPDGVKTIKTGAFSKPGKLDGQDALESVVVPKSVETIESGAFQYCKHLRKVSILGPAEIGSKAFTSCSNLEEVYLAEGVKSIGSLCFQFCAKIKYLYIPKSVTHVGWDIARMNDASYRNPVFRCYAKGRGANWNEDWNRVHYDPRFGDDRSHHYYHTTFFGVNRDGSPRQGYELVHTPCTNMPHGTGVIQPKSRCEAESWRLPQTKLRLWLTATIISMTGNKEYMLDDEEREMLPYTLRDNDQATVHQLDEPWEITIDDLSHHLAPELKINAWLHSFGDYFDGHKLIVHHDMPFHNDPYSEYPVSTLTPGGTVIAEKHIFNGGTTYDIRLHIHWPEQEIVKYTLREAFAQIQQVKEQLNTYKDGENEIDVLLAHSHWKAEKYKTYNPSEFPHLFFTDLESEGDLWGDLGQIVIQPYEFYEEVHSFSDDYKDAASAYGEDCDDWTTTERRETGKRMYYEIKA